MSGRSCVLEPEAESTVPVASPVASPSLRIGEAGEPTLASPNIDCGPTSVVTNATESSADADNAEMAFLLKDTEASGVSRVRMSTGH